MKQRSVVVVIVTVAVLLALIAGCAGSPAVPPFKKSSYSSYKPLIPCLTEGVFFRNPNATNDIWRIQECGKYYLCVDGEVLEFKCSTGLMFDIQRQICDYKVKVLNCDIFVESTTPLPLLSTPHPICPPGQLACHDRQCLPRDLFCDGQADCIDGSDEAACGPETDPNAASRCDVKNCTLPYCFCSVDGTHIPGNLPPQEVPQMIIITFDDAINFENWELYNDGLFKGLKNPNGCNHHATFFLSHEYTNYAYAQKLWNDGHEIAAHSITHRGPEMWWTRNATIEDWFDEMVGQANIINRFGAIHIEDIRGLRVPFLRVGWNRQFLMMREFGFVYDSSMVAPVSDPPLWPYTLDYKIPHTCTGMQQKCPSRPFPGIWEMVMNQLVSEEFACAMVDSCPTHLAESEILDMLMLNFYRHYDTNRSPYGLYFHTNWFKRPENYRAFRKFQREMARHKDVYFVTNWEAIQWMQNPTPLSHIADFEPWQCHDEVPAEDRACNIPRSCKLNSRAVKGDRYLLTCTECPQNYPWIKNEFGLEFGLDY